MFPAEKDELLFDVTEKDGPASPKKPATKTPKKKSTGAKKGGKK